MFNFMCHQSNTLNDKIHCVHKVVVQSLSHVWLFCDPVDYSPPGSLVHGVFRAKLLEWVSISFSRGSCQTRDQTQVSCIGRQILYHWATWEALLKEQNTRLSFSMNFIKAVNGMFLKQVLTSLFRIITCVLAILNLLYP